MICKLPCREAQISGCCGHHFCKMCLKDFIECAIAKPANFSCPYCKTHNFSTISHDSLDQMIKELEIYCPNKSNGCEWTGKLKDITKHYIDEECHDVECDKCREIISYTAIKSHLAVCPCYCQYCETKADKEEISSKHKEKCMKYSEKYYYCGKDIRHCDLMTHHTTCLTWITIHKRWSRRLLLFIAILMICEIIRFMQLAVLSKQLAS